jgi:hypothetical protein
MSPPWSRASSPKSGNPNTGAAQYRAAPVFDFLQISVGNAMTATLQESLPAVLAARARRTGLSRWAREPLLHFLLLGGLLFAVDNFVNGRDSDLRTIYVDAAVDHQARQVFAAARGREPNEEELYALRRVWLDNEVLYREGLTMGVDMGDSAIRERVIFKALSIVDANVKLPPYDDKLLRDWFEQHRGKYDDPARYDFQEAVLSGDNSESAVRSFVNALNAGKPGDANAGLRVFKDRPHASIVQSYGNEFAEALTHSSTGQWQALPTPDGWRAVRLDSMTPAKPANYDSLRGVVLQDWKDATAAELRSAAVRALGKKYLVKVERAAE